MAVGLFCVALVIFLSPVLSWALSATREGRTVKQQIRLAYTVEVDTDAYSQMYGTTKDHVRADVQELYRELIKSSHPARECGLTVVDPN
jgi:hypothetical protein